MAEKKEKPEKLEKQQEKIEKQQVKIEKQQEKQEKKEKEKLEKKEKKEQLEIQEKIEKQEKQDNQELQEIYEYLETYGGLDFVEKPLNEIDTAIFSQLIYNDFKDIAETDIPLSEAWNRFKLFHPEDEVVNKLGIVVKASKMLEACAKTKRFGDVIVTKYIDNVDDALDKQISAANFILSVMVSFRGTDATVTGLKESVMLAYMFPVPAQIEALHYFQETAMVHSGAVRACGHSKGGNLAVFAAVNCSNSLKKKIEGIYAFDAPGFPDWFFERYDYKEIEDRLLIYNPEGSIVGRFLSHNKTPEIVKSSAKKLSQHKVSTWLIDGDSFVRAECYDENSDKYAAYIKELVEYIGEEKLEKVYDVAEELAKEKGIYNFYDLQEIDKNIFFVVVDSLNMLNPEQKEYFNSFVKKVVVDFAKDYVSTTATKAKGYIKKVTNKLPFDKKKGENPAEEQETETQIEQETEKESE